MSDDEYDTKQPLHVLFLIHLRLVENLHPYSILSSVKNELQGYRDCVLNGINKDKLPPQEIKNEEEFYAWSYWKNCSTAIQATAWTTNKFKTKAAETYISIASKYLNLLKTK